MRRFTNPYTGMLDFSRDRGALSTDLVKFFLFFSEVDAGTSQTQGKVHKRSKRAASVGLSCAVEIKGFAHEMLNDFYVKAGMKDGSLTKRFGDSNGCTYLFRVEDTVMESRKNTSHRLQGIDNFHQAFDLHEVDGQYQVTPKDDDAVNHEVAETVQGLLNLAKSVVKDWSCDTTSVKPQRETDDDELLRVYLETKSLKLQHI